MCVFIIMTQNLKCSSWLHFKIHRLIEYVNTDNTTNLNADTGIFLTLVPIMGLVGRSHADFTQNTANIMTCNFTGKVKVTFSIYTDEPDHYSVEFRVARSGVLLGPQAVATHRSEAGSTKSQAFLIYEYDVTAGQTLELRCRKAGKNGTVTMSPAGGSFIKFERMA